MNEMVNVKLCGTHVFGQ